jgi:hypothetical protein
MEDEIVTTARDKRVTGPWAPRLEHQPDRLDRFPASGVWISDKRAF